MLSPLTMISTGVAGPQMRWAPEHLACPGHLSLDCRHRSWGPPLCHPSRHLLGLLPVHLERVEMQVRQVDWQIQLALLAELLRLGQGEEEVVQRL